MACAVSASAGKNDSIDSSATVTSIAERAVTRPGGLAARVKGGIGRESQAGHLEVRIRCWHLPVGRACPLVARPFEVPRALLVELVTRMIREVVQARDDGRHVRGNLPGGGSPPRTDRVAPEPALEERERALALASELAGEPGAATPEQYLLPRGVE
jgi:hypothetical protein